MKQIKTILRMNSEDFDQEVNEVLAEGWELVKRETLLIGQERAVLHCAELEKTLITEDEKTCENCKHYRKSTDQEPCASCDPEAGVCYWEAEE